MSSDQDTVPSSSSRCPAMRRPWTQKEDAALILAVKQYGYSRGPGSAWSAVSAAVGGQRTNKDCRKRWFHSLDPNLRKGKWSSEEDAKLKSLYAQLGPQWKDIALKIPGRKDDQVSKRWRDVLNPELTPKRPWASMEDAMLLQLYEEHGSKWTVIADHIPGRSPLACRNRSRKYLKISSGTRDQRSQNSAVSVEEAIESPQVDTSDGDGSLDIYLKWPFPEVTNTANPDTTAFQFDYSVTQPPTSTESVLSGRTGAAEIPQINLQQLFDPTSSNNDGNVDHLATFADMA
uniref:Myb-like domain-containing protein n=1 Tax=Kwoniella bestiolae CBS 10118 TaxID=1296100 RepID=A0A1B9GCP4_9TREE|nr:hypothetical protein I302_00279 [Kwoniella bestiolae CBS 10118]OCF28790.1 hypothetical protein I302_00279 [Kwoniella bestiolae CBS 10118]